MFVHDWSGTLEICIACPKQVNSRSVVRRFSMALYMRDSEISVLLCETI